MNQAPENYQQSYYQNTTENYEDYYENEVGEYQGNCGDAPSLRVPEARLYTEGFQDMVEAYKPFYGSPPSAEVPNVSYRRPTQALPADYYADGIQLQPFRPSTAIPSTQSYYPMPYCAEYPAYPAEITQYFPNSPYNHEVNDVNGMHDAFDDNCHLEKYEDGVQRSCGNQQDTIKKCSFHQNYNIRAVNEHLRGSEFSKDMYGDYRKRKFCGYGNRISRSAAVKKYPITVKTPKYVTKNFTPTAVSKRPSALCLPVVTQPDPALMKKKSKTNQQTRKNPVQSEQFAANIYDRNDTYSAHKMHSEGDVKSYLPPEGFERFLDKYENHLVLNEADDFYNVEQDLEEKNGNKFKEFAKFLKPRVPSSIRFKQERLANMKSTRTLQPKLKLSLDKLLNRLQKCEKNDDIDHMSERSCKTDHKDKKCSDNKDVNNKLNSFNYEVLSRKCSPRSDNEEKGEDPGIDCSSKRPSQSLVGPLEDKRSSRFIKPLDDHCALDLHRSKSYIVDLIDRALSKELGTVPRDQSIHHNFTPNKAVATISRHRQSNHKELCYEVTAALTDSIISNATAPCKHEVNQIVERSTSDGQIKEHISDDTYIKQLKQLRWGHIRHIQHEARKLADLEEFLEKCGEIEY